MKIWLHGVGSDSILSDFDAAGINYVHHQLEPRQIMNACEWVEILESTTPRSDIASVLVEWIRTRASRKVIVTLENKEVFHVGGMSMDEVERLLPLAKMIMALETKKPDHPRGSHSDAD